MAISNIFVSLLSLLALAVIPSPAEARANTVCALSSDGARVIRWDGNSWQKIGDAAGTLYGGGFALVATNPENSKVFAWAPNNGWQEIGGGGSQFVVTTSAIFGLNPRRDSVHKWAYEGTRWDQIGGPASAIYGGGGGGNDLYATSPGNTEVWRYGQAGTWDKVGGGGAQFAVDGNRVLYGLTGNRDAVYQYTGSGENVSCLENNSFYYYRKFYVPLTFRLCLVSLEQFFIEYLANSLSI